jgi:hypothetical protein
MKARTRSRLEMSKRALEFSEAHTDPSPGYTAAVQELKGLLARSDQLTDLHRQGIAEVRAATKRKRDLRRSIRQGSLMHVSRAAQRAAREEPELAQKFALGREPIPYLSFRSLARTLSAEAEGRKELLVKHGLVESVLGSLTDSLGQFDEALGQGAEGRRIHIAAGVELDVVAGEAVQILGVMDGYNRVRFAEEPDLLAAWKSASNIIGPNRSAKPEAPVSEGAAKPAA